LKKYISQKFQKYKASSKKAWLTLNEKRKDFLDNFSFLPKLF
jgi:hypothetical protein